MKKLSLVLISSLLLAAVAAPVSLVQNEYDFAAAVAKLGVRDAFLMYLDKQAMTLSPKPVNDYQAHEKAKPGNNGAKLTWYPVWALVSTSGDFGVDTGPWTYEAMGKDGKPETARGDWFTVWARDKQGQWKALFDAGIDHAAPAAPPKGLGPDAAVPQVQALSGPAPAAAVSQEQLQDAEAAFSKAALAGGLSAAYQQMGSDGLRLLQEDHEPVVGKAAVTKTVASDATRRAWIPLGGSVARSGDLGYLYGMTYAEADKDKQRPLGSYMHVWQRGANGWKLLVALDTPFPPAK